MTDDYDIWWVVLGVGALMNDPREGVGMDGRDIRGVDRGDPSFNIGMGCGEKESGGLIDCYGADVRRRGELTWW